jgi:DNA-binding beta-propeller fold protein YncE/Tol biopolymer transport system component
MLMGARRLVLVAVVWSCVVVMGLVLGGASALALNTHMFSGSFGGSGASAFSGPTGVAVNDETGNVYVVDEGHNRVEEFDSTGSTLLGGFDGVSAGHALSGPEGIAVDNSTNPLDPSRGDVYVVDTGHRVVDKFTAAGAYVGQLTETTGGATFGGLRGVAVDPNGVVWVYQASAEIDNFSDALSNEYLSQRPSAIERTAPGFAVDGEDNLYVNWGEGIMKLNSSGEKLIQALDGEPSKAVAVNTTSGEVFIDNESTIAAFDSTGGFRARFGAGSFTGSRGVAVNQSSNTVYVTDFTANVVDVFVVAVVPDVSTGAATGVQATSVTLNGTVNPDGIPVTSCVFEYGSDTSYGQSAPCEQSPGSGASAVAVSAELTGLREASTYHYRLRAANANGANPGEDRTFITPGRPRIDGQSSEGITQTSAIVAAQVNPHELATTYHFEYGTSTSYGTSIPVPDGSLSAGNEDQTISVELTGLQAGTVYHYRAVAVNSLGIATGSDATFTTEPPVRIVSASATGVSASSATLQAQINPRGYDTTYHFEYGTDTAYGASVPVPDGDIGSGVSDVSVSQHLTGLVANTTYHYRVWAHNALGTAIGSDHTFIYSTGGAGLPDNRAYEMVTPSSKNGAFVNDFLMGARPSFSGDGSRIILTSTQGFGGAGSGTGDRFVEGEPFEFTRTSGGWVTTPLAPPASQLELNTYWAANADTGSVVLSGPVGPGAPEEYYVNRAGGPLVDVGHPVLMSIFTRDASNSSVDLSHFLYTDAAGQPVEYAGAGLVGAAGGSQPSLVGVSGGAGSTDLLSVCGTRPERLSADGRRVIFSAGPCSGGSGANAGVALAASGLYERIDGSRTVAVSQRWPVDCASSACQSSPPSNAEFVDASSDGSRVFFQSAQQLTDRAAQGSNNLYVYDFNAAVGANLIAVSAGDTSGVGPGLQGVMAISPDGSHVYFVARGVLSAGANGQGQSAVAGADNLYVYERDAAYPGGRTVFIATLPETDFEEWASSSFSNGSARVTPDGRFLVFVSSGDLTVDDTSVTGAEQVFRYDALAGQLVRVSIGERGFNDNGNAGPNTHRNQRRGGALGVGALGDPLISNDGSYVFFTSPVGLTPGALNDVRIGYFAFNNEVTYARNLYEWHEGHVSLISDGRDVNKETNPEFSAVRLIGVDASGANVFFQTVDALVAQDTNGGSDVYDARICTASDPCVSSPPGGVACQGEGCRAVPVSQPAGVAPASESFVGAGNVVSAAHKAKPKKRKQHRRRKRRARARRAGQSTRGRR